MGFWSNAFGGFANTGNQSNEGNEDNEGNEANEGNEHDEGNEGNLVKDAASAISNFAGNVAGALDRTAGFVGDINGNEGNEGNASKSAHGTTSGTFKNTLPSGSASIIVSELAIPASGSAAGITGAVHLTITFVDGRGRKIDEVNGHSTEPNGVIDRTGEPWDFDDTIKAYVQSSGAPAIANLHPDDSSYGYSWRAHHRVWTGTDAQLTAQLNKAKGAAAQINAKDLDYRLLSQNSNSVAETILDSMGIKSPQTRGYTPGGGNDLIRPNFSGEDTSFTGLEYIASHSDLRTKLGVDAQKGEDHFHTHGVFEGRGASFDGLEYIASYGDLIRAYGTNEDSGATHYISSGQKAGRTTTFDGLKYIASYPDLIRAFGVDQDAGSSHFIKHGYDEGRKVSFNASQYLKNYGDLREAFGTDQDKATVHFIKHGLKEGRTDKKLAAPIVLDLHGDGVDVVPQDASAVRFDWDNDGFREATSWIGSGDGFLVYDEDGDGKVTSASEVAFAILTEDPDDTDLDALRDVFDANEDNVLDAKDEGWDRFRIWQDRNQSGVTDGGEMRKLDAMGIIEIDLDARPLSEELQHGGSYVNSAISVWRADGTALDAVDMSLSYDPLGSRRTIDQAGKMILEHETEESSDDDERGFVIDAKSGFIPYLESFGLIDNALQIMQLAKQDGKNVSFGHGESTLLTVHDTKLKNLEKVVERYVSRLDTTFEAVVGTSASDVLTGGDSRDALDGRGGADTLTGGRGADRLTGGHGADTFEFMAGSGADVITDFMAGEDELRFVGFGLSDGSQALSSAFQTGFNVVFEFGEGDSLTVLNAELDLLRGDILG